MEYSVFLSFVEPDSHCSSSAFIVYNNASHEGLDQQTVNDNRIYIFSVYCLMLNNVSLINIQHGSFNHRGYISCTAMLKKENLKIN